MLFYIRRNIYITCYCLTIISKKYFCLVKGCDHITLCLQSISPLLFAHAPIPYGSGVCNCKCLYKQTCRPILLSRSNSWQPFDTVLYSSNELDKLSPWLCQPWLL